MEPVRVKSYAKLNLTLHITGVNGGYHMLDSLVASVDMFDLISVKKRKDKLVGITMKGQGSESIPFECNNAVKAAELFVERYGTCGAEITVYKNIPMGLGLGGSSADSAGVLNALARLYKISDVAGLKLIADATGSDTRYMLSGGYARLFGRGDEVKKLDSKLRLDFLLLAPKDRVSTGKCFAEFDKSGIRGGNSDKAEAALLSGDKAALAAEMTNSLTDAAAGLAPAVGEALRDLRAFDPLAVNMTGSGSGVYALFENAEFCEYAKSRYRGNCSVYRIKTII